MPNKNLYFPEPSADGDEYAEIKAAADAVGESVSEFMRSASFARMKREKLGKYAKGSAAVVEAAAG